MTWKRFQNETILFLVCLVVTIFLIFPLLFLFHESTDKSFEYKNIVGKVLQKLIFPDEPEDGMLVWAIAISPWLVIQSGRFIIWSLSKLGPTFRGYGFATGLVVGICLIGGMWWWTEKSDFDANDPYYSARETSPKYWFHPKRDKSLKSVDIKDCHRFVDHRLKAKGYFPWEKRVEGFGDCMQDKGYLTRGLFQ